MISRFLFFVALLLASILTSISWLREEWSISIWVGMTFFFMLLPRDSRWKCTFIAAVYGIVGLGISYYWATKTLAFTLDSASGSFVPYAVFAALILWESVPFALMGWMMAVQHGRFAALWMAPMVWVILECFWPRVFPWSFAHSQTKFLSFLQSAELGGATLVSFLFLYACIGLSTLLRSDYRSQHKTEACLAIGLAMVAFVGGWGRLVWLESHLPAKSLRIGVVQIDPSFVDSPERMRKASDAMAGPIDLYVWPESTIGTYSTEVHSLKEMVQDISVAKLPFIKHEPAREMPSWLLVGGRTFRPGTAADGPYWQTAFLIDKDGKIEGKYNKRHLIPVGEFVPFEKQFPALHDWAQLSEYTAQGDSDAPVAIVDGPSIGVLICYEDLIESAARRTVGQGAQVLIGLINASAFEITEALEQHRRLSLLRTIENRRCFVRCAGTGVSCYISHTGREVQRMNPFEQGQFVAEVPLLETSTVYRSFGFLLPWFMIAALIARFCKKPHVKSSATSSVSSSDRCPD